MVIARCILAQQLIIYNRVHTDLTQLIDFINIPFLEKVMKSST